MLILHLFFALFSIIITSVAIFAPTKSKLMVSKASVLGTLVSGTVLVIATGSSLLSACLSGIFYLVVVSAGLAIASRRFASERS